MGAKIQFKPSNKSIQVAAQEFDVTNPPINIDIDDIVAIGSKINSFSWEVEGQVYKYYIPENVILFLDGLQYNSVYGSNDGFGGNAYANKFKFKFTNYGTLDTIAAEAAKEGGPALETNFGKFQKQYNLVDATVKAIEALPTNEGVSIVEVGVDTQVLNTYFTQEINYGPTPSTANPQDAAK
jgi:hypothetical protein